MKTKKDSMEGVALAVERSVGGYPFTTRREIVDRLDRDPAFVCECIYLLHHRHLHRALLPPPAGWSSSQRKAGEELAARLAVPHPSQADIQKGAALARGYAKQIAKVLRDEVLLRDPSLVPLAAVFGILPTSPDSLGEPYPEETEEEAETAPEDSAPSGLETDVVEDPVSPADDTSAEEAMEPECLDDTETRIPCTSPVLEGCRRVRHRHMRGHTRSTTQPTVPGRAAAAR